MNVDQGNLRRHEFATIIDPPYVMRKTDGSGQYEGFVIDLLDAISKSKFDYTLKVINGTYGHLVAGTNWTGLIGQMVTIPAEMAVGAIATTPVRSDVVQFTESFQSSSLQLLVMRPTPQLSPGPGQLFYPFTAAAWVLIVLAFLFVSAGLFLIGRFSPYEWIRVHPDNDPRRARHSFGLKNSFLFAISTFMWQGYREAPKSVSGRLLAVGWWAFCAMILVSYTANLTALLTSRPHFKPSLSFKNYEDILRDRKIDVGMIHKGDADMELSRSKEQLGKLMYEYVSTRHNWVGNLQEGLTRMRESNGMFAMLLPSYKARHLASQNCDLITWGHGLGMVHYAFASPAGNSNVEPLQRRINSTIQMMRQTGELEEIRHKWDGRDARCGDPGGSSLSVWRGDGAGFFQPMGVGDLAVAFVSLFLVGIFTVGAVALEILHARGYFEQFKKRDAESAAASIPLNAKAGPSAPTVTVDMEEDEGEKAPEGDEEKSAEELEPEDKDDKEKMDDVMLDTDDVKTAEDGGQQGEKMVA